MKNLAAFACLCILAVPLASPQQKKAAPAGLSQAALAEMCADAYATMQDADGWPEARFTILYQREEGEAPWVHDPAIKAPGLEAASSARARTLLCVAESKLEVGKYDSGEPGYEPFWNVTLIRIADRKPFSFQERFQGKEPPFLKYRRGAGVGERPLEPLVHWLHFVAEQKVARLVMRLKLKEYHDPAGLAFSSDGSKLVVVQETRSTSDGTPPTPITVFDLSTGKSLALVHVDYLCRDVAVSNSGQWIAANRYGHIQLLDASAGAVVRKFETSKIRSLLFGPGETLAFAGEEGATVLEFATGRVLSSAPGSAIVLSPAGRWLVAELAKDAVTVKDLESGNAIGTFHLVGSEDDFLISRDGLNLARMHVVSSTLLTLAHGAPPREITLPSFSIGSQDGAAVASSMSNGFAFASRDGYVGLFSSSSPDLRVFVTGQRSIKVMAASPDGKFLAIADSAAQVGIWELR